MSGVQSPQPQRPLMTSDGQTDQGFTLIEVVISISLVALMLTLMWRALPLALTTLSSVSASPSYPMLERIRRDAEALQSLSAVPVHPESAMPGCRLMILERGVLKAVEYRKVDRRWTRLTFASPLANDQTPLAEEVMFEEDVKTLVITTTPDHQQCTRRRGLPRLITISATIEVISDDNPSSSNTDEHTVVEQARPVRGRL